MKLHEIEEICEMEKICRKIIEENVDYDELNKKINVDYNNPIWKKRLEKIHEKDI